jgi:phenylpropionate dioxygenase-like ring-hydroxylating dioxygenase large terminal subunit
VVVYPKGLGLFVIDGLASLMAAGELTLSPVGTESYSRKGEGRVMAMSKDQQELLVRTGPGTPMGEVFRRYWLPAFLAGRLPEPDSPPISIKLLGEPLVAFRDSEGRVGLMDEACPHRGASLSYGRCEEGGLRCIYHGWKLDVDGNVLEAPAERDPLGFGARIKQKTYPTHEAGGIIWTYMGLPERQPEFPQWRFCTAPSEYSLPVHYFQECNYLQAIEGDIDAAHASYLHLDLKAYRERHSRQFSPVDFTAFFGFDRAPRGSCVDMPFGVDSVWRMGIEDPDRPEEALSDVEAYIVHPFILPSHSIVAGGGALGPYIWHAWVPIDDHHHYLWYVHYLVDEPMTEELRKEVIRYFGHDKCQPENEYRSVACRANRHLQDRDWQRTDSYTGVDGIAAQDIMVTQSQGYIVDRTKENLGAEDVGVTHVRRALFRAIEAVQGGGDAPMPATAEGYAHVDGYVVTLPKGTDWREVTRDKQQDRPAVESWAGPLR